MAKMTLLLSLHTHSQLKDYLQRKWLKSKKKKGIRNCRNSLATELYKNGIHKLDENRKCIYSFGSSEDSLTYCRLIYVHAGCEIS